MRGSQPRDTSPPLVRFLPKAGLRARERRWITFPIRAFPCFEHSGKVRNVCSPTVAGAAPEWPSIRSIAEWPGVTGFPFQSPLELSDHLGRVHHRPTLRPAHAVTLQI